MDLVMFAIIGAELSLGAGYWICFGIYAVLRLIKEFVKAYE